MGVEYSDVTAKLVDHIGPRDTLALFLVHGQSRWENSDDALPQGAIQVADAGTDLASLRWRRLSTGRAFGELAAFVSPHGYIELTVIFIAGGAGLRIAWAMIHPGLLRRRDALVQAGQESSLLVIGALPLLLVGLLVLVVLAIAELPRIKDFIDAGAGGTVIPTDSKLRYPVPLPEVLGLYRMLTSMSAPLSSKELRPSTSA